MTTPAVPTVQPVLLCIIDGWGLADDAPGNAMARAKTPHWDRLVREGSLARVEASAEAVGLPAGQMGNSEVGHLNLGAGRVVFQDIVRIDRDIREGTFAQNPALRGVIERTQAKGATLHLFGLTGPGGVHSHERHMFALLELTKTMGHTRVQVHAALDGRDTPPTSASGYLADLQKVIDASGNARLASISGRYWGMDRDQRWDRIERAYRALVHGEGEHAQDAQAGLKAAYARGENDEFVAPTLLDGSVPVAPADGFVFVNFRPDRARQLTRALADPGFDAFPVEQLSLDYVCMTQYQGSFPEFSSIAYPPQWPKMTLGEHLSGCGISQLRIAETEKYAHVTYFFSGGREDPFPGEERILIPSPKVATYDLQPEMSTPEITRRLVDVLQRPAPPALIVLNLACPDMVGHTGILDASIRAVEAVDTALGQLDAAVRAAGGAMFVTADHGNVEEMLDDAGNPVTKHSTNPVPLLLCGAPAAVPAGIALVDGVLADVAPTVLDLMGLDVPIEMDRASLLRRP